MFASIYPQPTITKIPGGKSDIKFPEDLQIILRADRRESGNLYLGNVEAAQNVNLIDNLKIGAILCVAKGQATNHPKSMIKHSKYLPLEDDPKTDLLPYLEEGVGFIHQKLPLTNVLVHCVGGNNRSACFIMGYLMRYHNLSLEDAFNEVKARRKVILPSEHMMKQLKQFQMSKIQRKETGNGQKSMRKSEASFRVDSVQDRTVRLKTNLLDRSNLLGVNDVSINNSSKMPNASMRDQREENRSFRSNKSFTYNIKVPPQTSHINFNDLNNSKIQPKNPEQSFISKHSKPSSNILDKSFSSNRPRSLRNASQISSEYNDLPDLKLQKKASSSREEFAARLRSLQVKNEEINQKIAQIHQKYQEERISGKMALEAQLGEINQLRANIYNERKIRLSRVHEGGVEYGGLLTTQ